VNNYISDLLNRIEKPISDYYINREKTQNNGIDFNNIHFKPIEPAFAPVDPVAENPWVDRKIVEHDELYIYIGDAPNLINGKEYQSAYAGYIDGTPYLWLNGSNTPVPAEDLKQKPKVHSKENPKDHIDEILEITDDPSVIELEEDKLIPPTETSQQPKKHSEPVKEKWGKKEVIITRRAIAILGLVHVLTGGAATIPAAVIYGLVRVIRARKKTPDISDEVDKKAKDIVNKAASTIINDTTGQYSKKDKKEVKGAWALFEKLDMFKHMLNDPDLLLGNPNSSEPKPIVLEDEMGGRTR